MLGCEILQIPMSLIAMLAIWICARLRGTTVENLSSYFLLLIFELDTSWALLIIPIALSVCWRSESQPSEGLTGKE